jgi:hypothetical protein
MIKINKFTYHTNLIKAFNYSTVVNPNVIKPNKVKIASGVLDIKTNKFVRKKYLFPI